MDKEKSVQTAPKEANLADTKEEPVVHSFDSKKSSTMNKKSLLIFVAVVILGILSGFGLSQIPMGGAVKGGTNTAGGSNIQKGDMMGSSDQRAFKDTAEGVLKKGGIEGEGAYHLVRPGGDSQNVYLTSSALDLGPLVGRKIKVWGQTNAAQTAGWLMDVGRVQVLN